MDNIEKIIKTIRDSHIDIEYLYMKGQCYNFHLILKSIFEDVEVWYDTNEGHIYSKIGSHWYDIRGRHQKVSKYCKILKDSNDPPENWGKRDSRRLIERREYEDKFK